MGYKTIRQGCKLFFFVSENQLKKVPEVFFCYFLAFVFLIHAEDML